jgi:sirohydrochlorin ferrochelatase
VSRALLIVDHGSRRPEAHEHVERLAAQVRERAPELYVYVAHLEVVPPSVEDALAQCAREGMTEVAVHPLFLIPGRHLTHDLPEQIERARARHPELVVRLLDALGEHPGLAELVLESLRSN